MLPLRPLVLFALTAIACSSKSELAATSGLAGDKNLVELTPAEMGTICDWTVSYFGGYSRQAKCETGVSGRVYPDQATCVKNQSDIPKTCKWTVTQSETCTKALAKDPCVLRSPPECSAPTDCNLSTGLA